MDSSKANRFEKKDVKMAIKAKNINETKSNDLQVFKGLFNQNFGEINAILGALFGVRPAWFADPGFAMSVTPPAGTSAVGAVVAARLRREGYDWRDTLRDLSTPTLVVHGAEDVLPLAEATRTAGLLPQARLLPIAAAGHNPFWEAPEAFFTAVDTFLAEGPPHP